MTLPLQETEGKVAGISDSEVRILSLLETAPAWSAEIAEHLGYSKWSQRPNGLYAGRKLVARGFATQRRQIGNCGERSRQYFCITVAGRAALLKAQGNQP